MVLNESLFEEYNESDNNLTEAKKRKKKKISQVNPGEAIFKSVKDMQKWVKKRQKGMGYFVHMDCGNMDYNNNMFNKMHGLGDTSSSSTTDGGASDAAPSGGEASVGMGESLKIIPPKKELRDYLTTREINFIKSNQNLLNNQDWIQFVQEMNDAFMYKENMYAIVDFLKVTLPEIDFTELEQLIDILE